MNSLKTERATPNNTLSISNQNDSSMTNTLTNQPQQIGPYNMNSRPSTSTMASHLLTHSKRNIKEYLKVRSSRRSSAASIDGVSTGKMQSAKKSSKMIRVRDPHEKNAKPALSTENSTLGPSYSAHTSVHKSPQYQLLKSTNTLLPLANKQ
jgi:hypothetical protein